MTRAGRAASLARALHDYSCPGVEDGWCDPGSAHSRLSLTLARDALDALDPAAVIHDATCEALLHCDGAEHIAWIREQFGHHWTMQAVPR